MEKIVGASVDKEEMLKRPEELDFLKEKLGLNLVVFGGAFNLPPQVRALNPFPEGLRGRMGPGLALTDDDAPLRQAVELAHSKGVSVWVSTVSWWSNAQHAPKLSVRDLWGRRTEEVVPVPYSSDPQSGHAFCPSNEAVLTWWEAAYAEIVRMYGVEGMYNTHSRYYHPAFYPALLACGCESCQAKAAELGYDFQEMKEGLVSLWRGLERLEVKRVRQAAQLSLGALDWLELLGGDIRVLDWLNFRAEVIGEGLGRFARAMREATNGYARFGAQAFTPSFDFLVGHHYADYERKVDMMVPVFSWLDHHFLTNVVSWANFLVERAPGLEEAEALRLVARFFGWDSLKLPSTFAAFNLGGRITWEKTPNRREESISRTDGSPCHLSFGPYVELMELEMRKCTLFRSGRIPFYPLIRGMFRPKEEVEQQLKLVDELGFEGFILHGYDSLL